MTRLLAIDPGCTDSGYAVIDTETLAPIEVGKIANHTLRAWIIRGDFCHVQHVRIEMVASYGMAVGKEVFETCVWIGKFDEMFRPFDEEAHRTPTVGLVYRRAVKLHHCGSAKAKDANITQALIDRFAPGEPNYGKGTKAAPGWFYGFKADIWQAYALAVYAADLLGERPTGEAD